MASFLSWKRPEIAIDFGTANVRIIRRDEGIVFDEPSLCSFERRDGVSSFIAAGSRAHEMIDRVPTDVQVKHALCRGVLQDIEAAKGLLRYALSQSLRGGGLRAPSAIIGVPADATQAERSAMLTAANDAGIGPVRLVSEPLAAAVGADLPVGEASGSMIIECGAGTTEVAIFSLGGLCETGSVRIGGSTLDRSIADYLHLHHKFLVGERTAEQLKLEYVAVRQAANATSAHALAAKGRCLHKGLPKTVELTIGEIDAVVEKHVGQIVKVVRDVLARAAPELSQDVYDRGVVLTGGGALTPLMRTMIAEATHLDVRIAENPAQSVATGLHRMLTFRSAG